MPCPYHKDGSCLPDDELVKAQDKYSELTQSALDAFHNAGAAYKSLQTIDNLKKEPLDSNHLPPLLRLFVNGKDIDKASCGWTPVTRSGEILLFETSFKQQDRRGRESDTKEARAGNQESQCQYPYSVVEQAEILAEDEDTDSDIQ